VICIEAACHFDTRDKFLKEALRVLGRIDRLHEQAADLVRQAGEWSSVRVKEPK
jgi:hypothetical protein